MLRYPQLVALATIALGAGVRSQVILDDPFDDGVVTGWQSVGNSLGATHNITEAGGELTSEVIATEGNLNTNRGIVSEASFDPAAGPTGFSITFEVSGQGALAPGANGMFLGLASSDTTFYRTAPTSSFGLVFFGHAARTLSDGGVSLVTDDLGTGGSAVEGVILDAEPGSIQLASLQDGFTATLRADPFGWSYEVTGISGPGGGATTVTATGGWEGTGTDFASLFGARPGWYVLASNQGDPADGTHFVVYDRITLSAAAVADTDGDGMTDAYETANGTDVEVDDAALDADGDGLTNLEEFLGLDPAGTSHGYGQTRSGAADSDGDGVDDGDEIGGALNPWSGGLPGVPPGDPTDPNDADSDDEGGNDGEEIAAGTDPNAPPANTGPVFEFVDSDGDGYSDEAEVAFRSDPGDPGSCPDHRPPASKPNLVIIYADDLGFGDISAYGDLYGTRSPTVTPHVDALASEGVLFTQAHSSNGVCTPSRYALLTGKYNWREFDGITLHYGGTKGGGEVPRPDDFTIAEFLKGQGYDTAAFGKWHLGGAWYSRAGARITGNPDDPSSVDWGRPIEHHAVAQGFDSFRGLATTINVGPYVYLHDDRVQFWDDTLDGGAGGYRDATNDDPFRWFTTAELNSTVVGAKDSRASLGDPSYTQVGAGPQMIAQVEDYLAERAGSGDTDPFFAYVALYSPHKPWAITPPFIGAEGFDYGDFMKEVDDRIGRVVAAVDGNGFGENTVVVFTSDNGPENTAMSQTIANGRDANGPLRGNKRDVWDGGTRVPFIVRWPGQAAPGVVSNDLIWQGDIFATMAAYLGVDLDSETAPDAESFLNLVHGQRKPAPRRPSIVVSANRGDLGLKTADGWKFIDSSGGGDATSWDSQNAPIPGAAGTDRGVPKQLFRQALDLGEDSNLIAGIDNPAVIRSTLRDLVGSDLLADLDRYRVATTAERFRREPDNDGDGIPNRPERDAGLDPDWPKDARQDLDGDGVDNLDEHIAGSGLGDPGETYRILAVEVGEEELVVTWFAAASREYEILWSADLLDWERHSIQTGGEGRAVVQKAELDAADGVVGNLGTVYFRISATGR